MTELIGTRRDVRAVGYALTSAVVGVIFMRLIVYFAPLGLNTYAQSLAVDALFSIPTQILFFLVLPFIVYMFYGKRGAKQVLTFSSAPRRFSPWWLLALPLGFCVWTVTIGVSSGWLTLLDILGYNYSSSEPPMPETFNAGFFVAEILMTAVLPAICEEFIMRGGTTTTMKKVLGTAGCVMFGALAFGLFHQNVRQVFYTALFGALATFLTIKLESIYPAVIMHFTNNFCSVFFNYAGEYGWKLGGGMLGGISALARSNYFAFFVMLVALAALGAGLVYLMLRANAVKHAKRRAVSINAVGAKTEQMQSGNNSASEIQPQSRAFESEACGDPPARVVAPVGPVFSAFEIREKVSARDVMFIVALAVVTTVTTVSTFVWGFFV